MSDRVNPFAAELADGGAVPEMVRRRQATQRTLDLFRGKRFSWSGRKTCVHLLHAHLTHCGLKVPRLPALNGVLAARKALARRGAANMAELLDQLGLERLPAPAMMTTGDVAFMPSADATGGPDPRGIGGVLICVSPEALLGFAEVVAANAEAEAEPAGRCEVFVMQLDQVQAAWRVVPA